MIDFIDNKPTNHIFKITYSFVSRNVFFSPNILCIFDDGLIVFRIKRYHFDLPLNLKILNQQTEILLRAKSTRIANVYFLFKVFENSNSITYITILKRWYVINLCTSSFIIYADDLSKPRESKGVRQEVLPCWKI